MTFHNQCCETLQESKCNWCCLQIEIFLDTLVSKVQQSIEDSSLSQLWGKNLSNASGYTGVGKRVHFLKKRVFERIGGYPLLGYGEDGIFLQKLNDYLRKNPKEKVVVDRNLVVFARRTSSIRELFRGHVWYGRTIVPYLKMTRLSAWFKLFFLFLPLVYLFSMVSIPLVLISPWFLIPALPYIVKLLLIFFESIRSHDKHRLLTPMVDFVVGVGHMIGLLQYLSRKRHLSQD